MNIYVRKSRFCRERRNWSNRRRDSWSWTMRIVGFTLDFVSNRYPTGEGEANSVECRFIYFGRCLISMWDSNRWMVHLPTTKLMDIFFKNKAAFGILLTIVTNSVIESTVQWRVGSRKKQISWNISLSERKYHKYINLKPIKGKLISYLMKIQFSNYSL